MEVNESPNFVVLEITRKCNLSCEHCYVNANSSQFNELSLDEIKALIDDLADLGVFVLGLIGGEPLVRNDVFEILDYAKRKGIATTMSTNGTLLSAKNVEMLKNIDIREVSVSLDGLSGYHNSFRGRDCFDKVTKGIKRLKNAGIYTIVSSCVSPQNFDQLEEFYRFVKSLEIDSWRLFPIIPTGRASKNLVLTPSQMKKLVNFVGKKKKEMPNMFVGESAGWCGEDDSSYKLVDWDGCRGGKEYCCISVEGYVKACPTLTDDFLEESIRNRNFSDIWKDKNTFKDFREFDTSKLKGKCGTCDKKELCGGGCRAVSLGYYKDLYQEFPLCIYKC